MASTLKTSESFLNYCRDERRMSQHTVRAYRLDLDRFGEFLMAWHPSITLADIAKEHLRAYQQTLDHLRPRSVSRRMAALRSLFYYAETEKLIATSPFEGFRLRIRTGRSLPRVLGRKTVEHLFRTLYNRTTTTVGAGLRKLQDIAVVELLFGAGLRVGEVASLSAERIDLDSESIRVEGKGARERLVPIVSCELKTALGDYAQSRQADRKSTRLNSSH